MATGCSLPRPVFQEPLGCCLAASHFTAPLMMGSVIFSSTVTSSLGTSPPLAGAGAGSPGAERSCGERMAKAEAERRAMRSDFLIGIGLVIVLLMREECCRPHDCCATS